MSDELCSPDEHGLSADRFDGRQRCCGAGG
jgi:hypothetical protein